jgi:hypothetical protein
MRYQPVLTIEALSADGCAAMSLGSPMGRTPRAFRPAAPLRAGRLTLILGTLVLGACSPGADGSPGTAGPGPDLAASSSGVCEAIAALPDLAVAQRAFTNLAHDALHGLAADPRLARSLSARVLETMQQVEADFDRPLDVAALTGDLNALHTSADAALEALGEEVPACAE